MHCARKDREKTISAPEVKTLLLEALGDERKAIANYAAVIDAFGPVRPFVNIIEAERRHANAIKRQLQRHGFAIPDNPWLDQVSKPKSLAEACEAAIQSEVENIALYDRLIPEITDEAIRQVFENLQASSRDNHLPAFRRCLLRKGSEG